MARQQRRSRAGARRWVGRAIAAAVAGVCAATATVAGPEPAPAVAAPVTDFYTPPAQFPTEPGAIVKTQPMPLYASLPSEQGWPAAADLVMYTSRLQDGTPAVVTGTFIDAAGPWLGAGPRPTVVIAPGTSGQGDQCAMSRAFATGVAAFTEPALGISANQELPSSAVWSRLGARVLVTDYIGLGTPGVHTYANRIEEAHAVLDAVRAANTLAGVGPETPVVLWGYSQGGGATAAAAELAPRYAPELNLKGTWAGGPVADLAEILKTIDGALIGGAIGFAVNALLARYPALYQALDRVTSAEGRAMLETLSNACIADVITRHPFLRTNSLTVDGRSLTEHLADIPEAAPALAEQRVGTLTPAGPVFITSGRNDDTVPYGQARALAESWCAQGATVTFRTNELPPILPGATIPNHFGPEMIDAFGPDNAVTYLLDRLAGKPVAGCAIDGA
ncbi:MULTISPECIES: lipase family protein [Nocardia]|nr:MULTISPECIES: lipase family protein [Nocardia]MBF6185252.1 lipase [Nocardia farcinica]MBF6248179.1 lipase [Nocardia elegans]MBF6311089.1 lipase [Nocardia farcinica]MBF6407708.1 lipase [Nocardia farcinica]UEX21612.1 lipase family protein [Nocardia farcinica]